MRTLEQNQKFMENYFRIEKKKKKSFKRFLPQKTYKKGVTVKSYLYFSILSFSPLILHLIPIGLWNTTTIVVPFWFRKYLDSLLKCKKKKKILFFLFKQVVVITITTIQADRQTSVKDLLNFFSCSFLDILLLVPCVYVCLYEGMYLW